MGRVLTNNTCFSYTIETALGVAGTDWFLLEPNTVNRFGAVNTTVARSPISKSRQRRKGTVTDRDSAVELEEDLTLSSFLDFIEGFCFATAINIEMDIASTAVSTAVSTASDEYTVAALTAEQADKLEFSTGEYATLVYGRGFINAENTGLKVLDADVATGATAIGVSENLVDEPVAPANAQVELAGLRSLAGASDWTWTWDPVALTGTLTSAADIADFTQFGIAVGMRCHVGSPDGSGGITNAFENAAPDDMFGYATVKSFATNSIVFENVDEALRFTDADAPATAVDLLFGKFIRNVDTDATDFLERSFQFEALYTNLQNPGPGDEYQYAKGNYCDTTTFNLPLADKATISFGFIGTDTDDPTTTRKTGAENAEEPVMTQAFNTSSDIATLRIEDLDETGLTTDFKSLSITLNNNVNAEKVLGTLGAKFMNYGNFEVDLEAEMLFTNSAVMNRITENATVSLDFVIKNDDGTISVEIPSMTLGDGALNLEVDSSVKIRTTGQAFEDPVLGYSVGVTVFSVSLP